MRQDKGRHGVDITAYFADFSPSVIERRALKDRYKHNRDNGGLRAYLTEQERDHELVMMELMGDESYVGVDDEDLIEPGHLLGEIMGRQFKYGVSTATLRESSSLDE